MLLQLLCPSRCELRNEDHHRQAALREAVLNHIPSSNGGSTRIASELTDLSQAREHFPLVPHLTLSWQSLVRQVQGPTQLMLAYSFPEEVSPQSNEVFDASHGRFHNIHTERPATDMLQMRPYMLIHTRGEKDDAT